jgi:hypothetical protein
MTKVKIGRIQEEALKDLRARYADWTYPALDMVKEMRTILSGNAVVEPPLEIYFRPDQEAEFCWPYELFELLGEPPVVRIFDDPGDSEIVYDHQLALPIDVLVVIASPPSMPALAGKEEIDLINTRLGSYHNTLARFDIVKGANTAGQTQDRVQQRRYQIVEIIAHGTDAGDKGGAVFFEDDEGKPLQYAGDDLAHLLRRDDGHVPTVVVLNGCLTSGTHAPSSGRYYSVAWHLLNDRFPAVIAMQAKVTASLAAQAGTEFFYTFLKTGGLDACVEKMRVKLRPELWYAPILATGSGFKRELLSVESQEFVRTVDEMNKMVTKLIQEKNCAELVRYLTQTIDSQWYPLIDKRQRSAAAQLLLTSVADELQLPL